MTRYLVTVNHIRCNSCGVCYAIDPTHFFRSTQDGKALVHGHGNGTGESMGVFQNDALLLAQETAASCPVMAITVTICEGT